MMISLFLECIVYSRLGVMPMIQDKEEKLQTIINSRTGFIVEQEFRIDSFWLSFIFLVYYLFLLFIYLFLQDYRYPFTI